MRKLLFSGFMRGGLSLDSPFLPLIFTLSVRDGFAP